MTMTTVRDQLNDFATDLAEATAELEPQEFLDKREELIDEYTVKIAEMIVPLLK